MFCKRLLCASSNHVLKPVQRPSEARNAHHHKHAMRSRRGGPQVDLHWGISAQIFAHSSESPFAGHVQPTEPRQHRHCIGPSGCSGRADGGVCEERGSTDVSGQSFGTIPLVHNTISRTLKVQVPK